MHENLIYYIKTNVLSEDSVFIKEYNNFIDMISGKFQSDNKFKRSGLKSSLNCYFPNDESLYFEKDDYTGEHIFNHGVL